MTLDEYEYKKNLLLIRYEEDRSQLDKEYALFNNNVKLGDIIKDNGGIVRVEKIMIHTPTKGKPTCVYQGIRLTKKLLPFKNGERCNVFQNSVIKP